MNCFITLKKVPIIPQRMDIIKMTNNTVCNINEGKKFDSYQRILSKRKAANICKNKK